MKKKLLFIPILTIIFIFTENRYHQFNGNKQLNLIKYYSVGDNIFLKRALQ